MPENLYGVLWVPWALAWAPYAGTVFHEWVKSSFLNERRTREVTGQRPFQKPVSGHGSAEWNDTWRASAWEWEWMVDVGFTVCSLLNFLKHICCLKATFVVFKTWGFITCKCCLEDNCNIKRKKMSRGLWGRILVLRDHEKLSMYISVLGETPKTNTHTWAWVAYSYKHMNM